MPRSPQSQHEPHHDPVHSSRHSVATLQGAGGTAIARGGFGESPGVRSGRTSAHPGRPDTLTELTVPV